MKMIVTESKAKKERKVRVQQERPPAEQKSSDEVLAPSAPFPGLVATALASRPAETSQLGTLRNQSLNPAMNQSILQQISNQQQQAGLTQFQQLERLLAMQQLAVLPGPLASSQQQHPPALLHSLTEVQQGNGKRCKRGLL